ncbi:Smr/MutS family protein [Trichlorobacter lovleyi]|uniref:Smr/MutS family protein n=1 Tax=Trichlorobacter lovleyi TaxID=313985 RepID=UPI00223F95C3|nr:Smr/MutS family protein [Trichlorobacter lovleyi]QOX77735.1 Smr/MutS family protein [Trichlorobacter lovleyi]
MAQKKQKTLKPAAPPPFRTNPFAALKGIAVETAPPPEPVKKAVVPKAEPAGDELFRQAMSGVRRLDDEESRTSIPAPVSPGKKGAPPKNTARSVAKPLPREEAAARKTFLQEVEKLQLDVRFKDQLPEEEELRPLTGNRLRQLKRGIIQLDRQLDLHGLTREEALASLGPFLQAARNAGEKGALVITGKGNHSLEGPVLQQVVAAWLRDQGRDLITEYAPAPAEMGGSGAFVIFLRPLDK